MKERDGPVNIFRGLTVVAKVTAVYEDFVVTKATGMDGKECSVTFSRDKWNSALPLKAGDIVLLGKIRLLDGRGYRSYNPQPQG